MHTCAHSFVHTHYPRKDACACATPLQQEAKELLEKFLIGTVKPGTKGPAVKVPASVTSEAADAGGGDLVALRDPRERYAMPLVQRRQLSHDTLFLRFALPSPAHRLGLPCGKHVFLCAGVCARAAGVCGGARASRVGAR